MHHIEGYAPLQAESFCRKHVEPGVKAFEHLALKAYANSHSDGDNRPCQSGTSEHYDGRAWDWGVDHRKPKLRADGRSMLHWLFAKDADGNKAAVFRRLGLMYVIWNKRIWGTWSKHWEPYRCRGANACHVTHIHFSFGWAGAERKTSYWTGKVSPVLPPDYPVFAKGHRTITVRGKVGAAAPIWQLKGGAKYDVTATGVWRHSKAKHGKADALCVDSKQGWAPLASGGVKIDLSAPSASRSRWHPLTDTGKGCNLKTHTYRLRLAPSHNSAVRVRLPGAKLSNNSGSITLRFVRA
jgi:hypothetical protein